LFGYVQEDPRNDDTLLFQRFLEESEPVVERFGEGGKIEPDVEGCFRWDGDGETHSCEPLKAVVSFDLQEGGGEEENNEGQLLRWTWRGDATTESRDESKRRREERRLGTNSEVVLEGDLKGRKGVSQVQKDGPNERSRGRRDGGRRNARYPA